MDGLYGHFIEVCIESGSDDPVKLFRMLIRDENVPMHSRIHHVIVPMVLTTAYWHAVGGFDLRSYLTEVVSRASEVPEMICGYWGCCGSAVGTGLFFSVITRTNPISKGKRWAQGNRMTARSLEAIADIGGPRCCKRNAVTSILAACRYLKEETGVELHPSGYGCTRDSDNRECIGNRCPYYIVKNRDM